MCEFEYITVYIYMTKMMHAYIVITNRLMVQAQQRAQQRTCTIYRMHDCATPATTLHCTVF